DFPNTRMQETLLWLPYQAATKAAAPETTADRREHAPIAPTAPPRLLAERWVRLSHRSLIAPRAIEIVDHTGSCSDLVATLRRAAADIGATATTDATADFATCVI